MIKFTKTGHFICSKIGQAIGDYNLIEEDDRILVAVSGGKDSLTLLKMLKERQKWSPVKFEILAAHIKTDFRCKSCVHVEVLEKLFKNMSVKYVFKEISILRKERKPSCFWCSYEQEEDAFPDSRES